MSEIHYATRRVLERRGTLEKVETEVGRGAPPEAIDLRGENDDPPDPETFGRDFASRRCDAIREAARDDVPCSTIASMSTADMPPRRVLRHALGDCSCDATLEPSPTVRL